ncbi:unnamed protein product [Discosporangium mesarthrocarpum]
MKRLAVTGCDWDHMRAMDLAVLCSSFCPGGVGGVRRTTVYPSDFGLEMMEREALVGPHGAVKKDDNDDDGDDDGDDDDDDDDNGDDDDGDDGDEDDGDDNGDEQEAVATVGDAKDGTVTKRHHPGVIIESLSPSTWDRGGGGPGDNVEGDRHGGHVRGRDGDGSFDPESLRGYELRKLKYYFGVLECSSVAVAEAVYRQVDGMEFEHSSVALDLRFIPDDVSFEGRTVRDRCTGVPSEYKPPTFICKARWIGPCSICAALQQTKVECTWDEVPSERQSLLSRMTQWQDATEEAFEVVATLLCPN